MKHTLTVLSNGSARKKGIEMLEKRWNEFITLEGENPFYLACTASNSTLNPRRVVVFGRV